jgi:hypothetical protein
MTDALCLYDDCRSLRKAAAIGWACSNAITVVSIAGAEFFATEGRTSDGWVSTLSVAAEM